MSLIIEVTDAIHVLTTLKTSLVWLHRPAGGGALVNAGIWEHFYLSLLFSKMVKHELEGSIENKSITFLLDLHTSCIYTNISYTHISIHILVP